MKTRIVVAIVFLSGIVSLQAGPTLGAHRNAKVVHRPLYKALVPRAFLIPRQPKPLVMAENITELLAYAIIQTLGRE